MYSLTCPSTKNVPISRVSRYQRRSPNTSPRSAANTPNWQVNDEATSTIVTTSAYGTFSSVGSGGQPSVGATCARAVKYIANRPAKNISSLDSQIIVPTLTRFGRFSEWMRALMVGAAVVTPGIMTPDQVLRPVGDRFGAARRTIDRPAGRPAGTRPGSRPPGLEFRP